MLREAREKRKTGNFHIMIRGINHQSILKDDESSIRFIEMFWQKLSLYYQIAPGDRCVDREEIG